MDFNQFLNLLVSYLPKNLIDKKEVSFLWEEYLQTEKYWERNLTKINNVKLIILGEAPLNSDAYIYNKASKDSSFLYAKHIKSIYSLRFDSGVDFQIHNKIDLMNELGIVAIDLFPYSFSSKTKFNYRNRDSISNKTILPSSSHNQLLKTIFKDSSEWHFNKKVADIVERSQGNYSFVYRYNALKNLELEIPNHKNIESIGKSYDLDFLKLKDQYFGNL